MIKTDSITVIIDQLYKLLNFVISCEDIYYNMHVTLHSYDRITKTWPKPIRTLFNSFNLFPILKQEQESGLKTYKTTCLIPI